MRGDTGELADFPRGQADGHAVGLGIGDQQVGGRVEAGHGGGGAAGEQRFGDLGLVDVDDGDGVHPGAADEELATVGLVVGALLALGLSKLLAAQLIMMNTFDAIAYAGGTGVVDQFP